MISRKLKSQAAVMLGIGEPIGAVSQELGVSRQSIYNWRSEPKFLEEESRVANCLEEFKNFVKQEICFANH